MESPPTRHRRSRTHLLPRTPLGWWAVRLLILFAVLFLPSVALAVSDRWLPWSPRVGFMGLLVGVLAGVTAAVAVARRGERAVLVFLPLTVSVFCAIALVNELVQGLSQAMP